MQEMLTAFGIDYRLIVIQVFNFAILVGALWYFLYTPVLKLLAEREEKIKKGVHDAEKAAVTLSEADSEKNRLIKEAHLEAGSIVSRGTAYAEEQSQKLNAEAEEKIAKRLAEAATYAAELKEKALKESEAEVAKVALLAAEKILNERAQ